MITEVHASTDADYSLIDRGSYAVRAPVLLPDRRAVSDLACRSDMSGLILDPYCTLDDSHNVLKSQSTGKQVRFMPVQGRAGQRSPASVRLQSQHRVTT